MILPIWQPVGFSTNEISRQVSLKLGVKTSHTGTLDPMASGVIIILPGDLRYKKYDYAFWEKEYEFEVCFGISTDSFDGLGLILTYSDKKVLEKNLLNVLENIKGSYSQQVPLFSAVKHKGKKLFEYAHEGIRPAELPIKKGTVIDISLQSFETKPLSEIIKSVLKNIKSIKSIKGNFRQDPIIKQWEEIAARGREVQVAKIRTVLTKGLYVRGLSQDICSKLNADGFVAGLMRTRNGAYTKNDCFNLTNVL